MVKGIDHVVIAVKDLDEATSSYTQLGFTAVPGGRHAGLGTSNALIAFADGAYIELIAFTPPVPPALNLWYSAIARGGGMVDFCAQTDDLVGDSALFRRAGATIGVPFSMERLRPDGYRVSWMLATTEGASCGLMPFFIRDITPRDERLPRDRRHRNDVLGIRSLAIAISDHNAIANIYSNALGTPGVSIDRSDLGASGTSFMLGCHELHLLEPKGRTGVVAKHLDTCGPSPLEIRLSVSGSKVEPLDLAATHGVRLVLG